METLIGKKTKMSKGQKVISTETRDQKIEKICKLAASKSWNYVPESSVAEFAKKAVSQNFMDAIKKFMLSNDLSQKDN